MTKDKIREKLTYYKKKIKSICLPFIYIFFIFWFSALFVFKYGYKFLLKKEKI